MTSNREIPQRFTSEEDLEDFMTRPTPGLVSSLAQLEGDLTILGVGGKMGPTLARMARRALDEAGREAKVIGVSRFSNAESRRSLERYGIETLQADLLDRTRVERLPDCPNLVFMAGMKFGATDAPERTWAMNALVPAYVAERFPDSKVVAFSTGNVYPFTPVDSGGPTEETPPAPLGEYGQSVLARERVFQYFAKDRGLKVVLIRLNYAIDLRYGVLLDVARKVWSGTAVDLSMGYANVIWQGDANRQALQAFSLCSSPASVLNVTGSETLSIRKLAEAFGERLGKPPVLENVESDSALLSDASKANALFGPSEIPVERMIDWIADWVLNDGPTLDKPTHFETRDGNY